MAKKLLLGAFGFRSCLAVFLAKDLVFFGVFLVVLCFFFFLCVFFWWFSKVF